MSENVVHLHKPTDPPTDDPAPTVLTVVPDAPPAPPVPLWVRSGRRCGRPRRGGPRSGRR